MPGLKTFLPLSFSLFSGDVYVKLNTRESKLKLIRLLSVRLLSVRLLMGVAALGVPTGSLVVRVATLGVTAGSLVVRLDQTSPCEDIFFVE